MMIFRSKNQQAFLLVFVISSTCNAFGTQFFLACNCNVLPHFVAQIQKGIDAVNKDDWDTQKEVFKDITKALSKTAVGPGFEVPPIIRVQSFDCEPNSTEASLALLLNV